MCRNAVLDMRDTAIPEEIEDFLADALWAVCSTYHTVLKASPGAAVFGRDVLFDIPYVADLKKWEIQVTTDRYQYRTQK